MTEPLRIGIAGLGTVGTGVVKILQQNAGLLAERAGRELRVVAVSSRDRDRDRGINLHGIRWYEDAVEMTTYPALDVVCELIGGAEGIARAVCESTLTQGKHLVSANKALIAHHGQALASLAATHGKICAYEAAVAGGIPIIKVLREGLAANRITRIQGIMNGTCNYILTTMEKTGKPFAEVLAEAQAKGYAEADPTFDVDGMDTAHKLAILAGLAFGFAPTLEPLPCEGIRQITIEDIRYARELGYRIKLLGIAASSDGQILQRVNPALVPLSSPLGTVEDVYNAIQIEGDFVGKLFLEGRGAGEGPTASSVVADIIDIARGIAAPTLGSASTPSTPPIFCAPEALECSYYLRLGVLDKAGVLAEVTSLLKEAGISLRDVSQHSGGQGEVVQIVLTTHRVREANMNAALTRLHALDSVVHAPCMIRIEA